MSAPRTFQEVHDLIAAASAKFREDTAGIEQGTQIWEDAWARYVAYNRAQWDAYNAYAKEHYPPLTYEEGRRAVSLARQHVRAARAANDADYLVEASDELAEINYRLWGHSFDETLDAIKDHTADISDPFAPQRAVVDSTQDLIDILLKEQSEGMITVPVIADRIKAAEMQLKYDKHALRLALGDLEVDATVINHD